jgi:hypothetical protein
MIPGDFTILMLTNRAVPLDLTSILDREITAQHLLVSSKLVLVNSANDALSCRLKTVSSQHENLSTVDVTGFGLRCRNAIIMPHAGRNRGRYWRCGRGGGWRAGRRGGGRSGRRNHWRSRRRI